VPARGGSARRLTSDRLDELSPSWSPDGTRIAFARGPGLASIGPGGGHLRLWLVRGADPASGAVPARPPLLPDLDQLAPSGLVLRKSGTRWQLGSTTQVANRGRGPLHILGTRPSAKVPMVAQQVVSLRGGGSVVRPDAGVLRYVHTPEHDHFHFLPFESYELRSADDRELLVRDHKSGFCIGDRRGHSLPGAHAQALFTGYCDTGDPTALRVEEGESVGWVDRYPGFYHGQFVDVTGVPPGEYLLVHRANPRFNLLERSYANDVAALRIRLTWTDGVPHVAVLRTCPGTERC
jgi:lysyl oxidase/WD40 repeat protein